MVRVEELVKIYDGFKALNGLNMQVEKGSIYGLVGPNGSGKSTLLKHIAGISRQDSGSVLVAGEPVYENTAVKSRIAWVPDAMLFYRRAAMKDLKKLYSEVYPRFDSAYYDSLGEIFDGPEPDTPVHRVSKGMQKQAAFRLALSIRPELLLLDEPVDGLDPAMRRRVWKLLLKDVTENGTTVIVSSHNLRELEDVCGYIGIISGGRMLTEKSLRLMQEEIVKVQLVYPEGMDMPADAGIEVIRMRRTGRLIQLTARGSAGEVSARLAATGPVLMEVLPMNLEEIFISELGGQEDEVSDIFL